MTDNGGALAMFKKGLNRYSMLEAHTSKKHSSLLEAQTPFLNIANAMLCGASGRAVASVVFIKNNFSVGNHLIIHS